MPSSLTVYHDRIHTLSVTGHKKANPLRGRNTDDLARLFIRDYPIGSQLSVQAFDEWAEAHGVYSIPRGVEKSSDAWLAHCQRRHRFRIKLDKAGTHPRMEEDGTSRGFKIDTVSQELFEVRSPLNSIFQQNIPRQTEKFFETKLKEFQYRLESLGTNINPHKRQAVENLIDNINTFRATVAVQRQGYCLSLDKAQRYLETDHTENPSLTEPTLLYEIGH